MAGATLASLLTATAARESLLLLVLLGLAGWVGGARGPLLRLAPAAIATAALVAAIVAGAPVVSAWFAPPRLDLADHRHAAVGVASFAARETPEDAVFLAPPDFGHFRLLAGRALVVDFRSFPFHGPSMEEWRERLDAVYGPTRRRGYGALAAFDRRWRGVTDERLRALSSRYGAGYAVLHRGTATALPVLYEDDAFTLVSLRPAP